MGDQLPATEEVWTFAEHRRGEFTDAALGLLGEGKRLCRKRTGSRLCAVVLSHGIEGLEQRLGPYGAERIYSLEHEAVPSAGTDTAATLMADLIKEKAPFLVLFPADSAGSDLAARVAAKLRAPLVTNCVDIKTGSGGKLEFVKPVSDEMLYASVQAESEGVRIATVAPEVMDPDEPDPKNQARVQTIHAALPGRESRLRTLERIPGDPGTIALEEAEIIVAGGRGTGDPGSFNSSMTWRTPSMGPWAGHGRWWMTGSCPLNGRSAAPAGPPLPGSFWPAAYPEPASLRAVWKNPKRSWR